jgi:hypothetical protein
MRARIATERLSTTRPGAPVDQFPKVTRSYSEAKGTGMVAACPSRASAGALLAFIAMVPRTLEGRQGLRPDVSAVTLSAVRGRIAADREGGRRRNEERGREANHRNWLDH